MPGWTPGASETPDLPPFLLLLRDCRREMRRKSRREAVADARPPPSAWGPEVASFLPRCVRLGPDESPGGGPGDSVSMGGKGGSCGVRVVTGETAGQDREIASWLGSGLYHSRRHGIYIR